MPPYAEKFPVGTTVQVADSQALDRFRASWHLHNPLTAKQLGWAGHRVVVAEVGFYHGGDPLYVLQDVPGVWHEECLVAIADQAP